LEQKYQAQRDAWRAFKNSHTSHMEQWKKDHPDQNAFLRNRAIHDRTV
jgi:hypothetical protein